MMDIVPPIPAIDAMRLGRLAGKDNPHAIFEPLYQFFDAISKYFHKCCTYAQKNRAAQRFGIGIWGEDYEHS
jgi:hypothetical protein